MNILIEPIEREDQDVETSGDAGNLLADLERRQDDVLAQLDELDRKVSDLLRGLGVTLIDDSQSIGVADDNAAEEANEPIVGFAKLPQGEPSRRESSARSEKRVPTPSVDAVPWEARRRAA